MSWVDFISYILNKRCLQITGVVCGSLRFLRNLPVSYGNMAFFEPFGDCMVLWLCWRFQAVVDCRTWEHASSSKGQFSEFSWQKKVVNSLKNKALNSFSPGTRWVKFFQLPPSGFLQLSLRPFSPQTSSGKIEVGTEDPSPRHWAQRQKGGRDIYCSYKVGLWDRHKWSYICGPL